MIMEKYANYPIHRAFSRKRLFLLVLIVLVGYRISSMDYRDINDSWKLRIRAKGYKRPGYEKPLANGIPLRVMGLGASTVFGQESAGSTGWRPTLRQNLVAMGNPVNMVGSQRVGDMIDNDVEAYPGARIDILYNNAQKVVEQLKPNLAIVYMGSNDNFQNASLPVLYKRYYAFVNFVLSASPRATVIMGTLMPTTETQLWGGQDRVAGCNQQLRRLYQIFKRENKPVVLVDMDDKWGVQIENLGPDHMHPTRAGYEIMSRKFLEGILEADARGFLQAPEYVEGVPDNGELNRLTGTSGFDQKQLELETIKIEEEAIEIMISELERNPWDGSPAVNAPVLPIPDRPAPKNNPPEPPIAQPPAPEPPVPQFSPPEPPIPETPVPDPPAPEHAAPNQPRPNSLKNKHA